MKPHAKGYPIKIVRDRTPEIINSTGEPGDLFYGCVPPEERPSWLRRKLIEEAAEYVEDRRLDELSQVLCVVEGLAATHGLTLDYLIDVMRADPRGGFLEGVMMYGLHPEYDRPT
jgi:predicted house-cleaning noncanonical NTP pyrophosphatase (MazG superfamily)